MFAYIDGTTTEPSWLTYDALTNEWQFRSISAADEGVYVLRQFI
jgi:hypothetical protein